TRKDKEKTVNRILNDVYGNKEPIVRVSLPSSDLSYAFNNMNPLFAVFKESDKDSFLSLYLDPDARAFEKSVRYAVDQGGTGEGMAGESYLMEKEGWEEWAREKEEGVKKLAK